MTCPVCNVRLNWREERVGVCRVHDPNAVPYPGFCLHPDRCDGCSCCPRDYSCVE